MRKRRLSIGILILAIVFMIAGVGLLFRDTYMRDKTENQYQSLANMARESTKAEDSNSPEKQIEKETKTIYHSPIQFDELKKINPDIVGWITIEGTKIDYPIVHTDNNETYLETGFDGKKSVAGTVFLDYQCAPDFTSKHNILYGHNMKNGSMFKDIVKYKDKTFFKEHQNIIIYTPQKEYHLRPLTALYTDASPIRRKTEFKTMETFDAYVKEMTESEQLVTQLWSFVTCSYEFNDARTILYAYEVPQVEK